MKSAPAALAALALASAPLPAAPADVRTGPLKDLNGYFPFSPPASTETWQTRRAALQLQTQIALGLHPLPEKTPLNPSTDGRITGDVDFASTQPVAGYLTPVPGGVGPVTVAMLLRNTLRAAGGAV
jgi:hypothetical protein